jgi:predicted metalloprotease with PDZ domain
MNRKVLFIGIALLLVSIPVLWAVASEKDSKAYLGIYPGEVTSDIAASYGVKAGEGVVIEGVASNSPADEAGLRTNDVILKINELALTGPEEFRQQIAKFKPKDSVDLTFIRGGQQKTIKVTLGEREAMEFGWGSGTPAPQVFKKMFKGSGESEKERRSKTAFAGIVTQELSEGLAKYFKVEKGALISEVVKDSPAEKAGLKAGDVIISIGKDEVEDPGDVREAIHDHKPGDAVDFAIKRDGNAQTISVILGDQTMSKDTGFQQIEINDDDPMAVQVYPGPEDLSDIPDMHVLKEHLKDARIYMNNLSDESLDDLRNNLKDLRIEINGATKEKMHELKEKLHDIKVKINTAKEI